MLHAKSTSRARNRPTCRCRHQPRTAASRRPARRAWGRRVATLHPDDPYEPYLRTRHFYEAMGFVYVHDEQFPADPENPMAHYLKQL
jgi:hypothetical protein